MIDYTAILNANYAGKQWTQNGDSYDGIDWLDETPKPSQSQLDAEWPQVDYNNQCKVVQYTRHAEYVAISDPIFFEWQRGTKTQADWENAVQTIKDANPYPLAP